MPFKLKILIVENEATTLKYLNSALTANNYTSVIARNESEALTMITSHCPDIILLDADLPFADPVRIIKATREWSQIPIIIISENDKEKEKIRLLDNGADDYITKPLGIGELLARIRVSIRHTKINETSSTLSGSGLFKVGDLLINFEKRLVTIDDNEIHLTKNEYKIVELLCRYSGKVLTYDFFLKNLWGPMSNEDNQILRVNMANIRRKIAKYSQTKYIYTESGIGYRMTEGENS